MLAATERLDAAFAALADPTRRAILARLASGERTVQDLARPFDISAPAISRHLKVLEDAGLLQRGRVGQKRPCRLQARPLKEIADWLEHYRKLWDERLDRLDSYLRDLQQSPPSQKESKHARKK